MESSREPDVPVALPEEVRAVNVGLPMFADALLSQGAAAIDVDWRIPAGGRADLVAALTRLYGPASDRVDGANQEAMRRLDRGAPVLLGVRRALDEIPGMEPRMILHPGPPLPWGEFCDPLRRSVRAAAVAEGWASSPEEADALVASSDVSLGSANSHRTVVPMATALGPSAPVFVIENRQGGNRAYSAINQGPGQAAWFGVDTPEAVERLVFLREAVGPALSAVLRASGPIDVFSLVSQGLQMGDDAHMRTQATTNLLIRHLLPYLAGVDPPGGVEVARFLSANHLFFLNVAMAAAKAVTDWAAGVPYSTVVVGMARNGTTFGIRLSGTGDRWFLAPAPPVGDALYHSGFGPDVGAPDIGDSAVLELVGLGGAAAAASPAVAAFVGGTMADAVATTEAIDRICIGRSSRFKLPFLDHRGSPLGVDVRKVVETQVTPAITTGILHATEGLGQVGAGVARAPLSCFENALLALDAELP
ncbi:MAG: oxamate carbamoyltransferase subunit AllG family protein [Actinomycetota bacterium]